jgi:prevent-host-death family protein
MSDVLNIAAAKAHFSELVDKAAQQGITTIIAKAGTPIAKIVPLADKPKKVIFGTGKGVFTDEIVAALEKPLPPEVLASFYTDNLEP